jgi:hypothetical protein
VELASFIARITVDGSTQLADPMDIRIQVMWIAVRPAKWGHLLRNRRLDEKKLLPNLGF